MASMKFPAALAGLILLVGVGCGGGESGTDVVDDAGADIAGDIQADVAGDIPSDIPSDGTADVAGDDGVAPDIHYWQGPQPLSLAGGIYDQVPSVFSRISRFVTEVDGPEPVDPSFLGGAGVGNGLAFAMFGYGNPLNSMHSFAGPGYDLGDEFFGDYSVGLAVGGAKETAAFDRQVVAITADAPVVVARGTVGQIELHVVSFAPWFGGAVTPESDSDVLRHCIMRVVEVRNPGPAAPVVVRVLAHGDVTSPQAGRMLEEDDGRVLVTAAAGATAQVEGRVMAVDLGEMGEGASRSFVVTHCAFAAGQIVELPEFDAAALLARTADAYRKWESELVDVETPDPMVNDFIDGMKLTLKLQTSDGGATCPMSEYTRTWARDNMGPVLAMLSLGGFADVEAYLDYVYYAILKEGDLKNSYPANLEIDWDGVVAPDWDSMPPLGEGSVGKKRVSAETPSYMVLMYGLHNRFTGKADRIVERLGLLRRCLFAQGFSDGDMLPFTGDETFRAAMNAALGLGLEEPHEDTNWSGNSSALWLGAAREYARFMEQAGQDAESAMAQERFEDVEAATLAAYTRPDKCFAALVSMSDMAMSKPFEDASLQVTWSGWKDGDDPYARDAFSCLYETARTVPGEICSKLDTMYGGVFRDAWDGVYTGMMPGYALHSMTVLGHPDAFAAFNMVRKSLDTLGNVQEYLILDDHSGLTLMYNDDGVTTPSDYTAKYRPWEGGIVLDAVLQFLFGFEPDANTQRLELRPHLPNGWPQMSAKGLRAGSSRFDVSVSSSGAVSRVTVTSRSDADWIVSLRWDDPVPGVRGPTFTLDGGVEPLQGVTRIDTPWMPTYLLPDLVLKAGESLQIVVTGCGCGG
ncbi:MAG TPA: hypothetical protein PLC24_10085 [Myxococcota bacterium]|nr:hypothetical protein [Myxococcota bacterium]